MSCSSAAGASTCLGLPSTVGIVSAIVLRQFHQPHGHQQQALLCICLRFGQHSLPVCCYAGDCPAALLPGSQCRPIHRCMS